MAETVLSQFRRTALRLGEQSCFHYKRDGVWTRLAWVDAEETVRRLSLGWLALGLKKGERVCLISQTRMEWTLLDLSILAAGGVCVPIYPTLSPDQMAYIIKDSGATHLVLESKALWQSLEPHLGNARLTVLLIEGNAAGFIDLTMLQERGRSLPVNHYDENLRQMQPTDLATVVYTSGTTGPPKGVMLTHRNLIAEIDALREILHFHEDEIGMMLLPLSHVIARAMQFYQLAQGCQAAYAESLENLPANLREVSPHFMAVVPRLLEKSHEKIMAKIHAAPGWLRRLFFAGLEWGVEIHSPRPSRSRATLLKRFCYSFISLLLFRKIRKGFGGRLHCFISGGAALSKEVASFFQAIGMQVLEGYGLTETFAAVTLNRGDDFRFGTVGKPLEAARIKISPDGEICVKGDTVFSGYWGLKQETLDAFDPDGWFLTGDIGEFTKDGFLRITDRKKDIIVTSGGKNISPQNIESRLQQSSYIQQAFVYGEGKHYLCALLTLNWETVEVFAKREGIDNSSHSELVEHPKLKALIAGEIERINQGLSRFETIKKFAILDENFSVESGTLTPTMKIKRKVVAEKYRAVLERLYN